jgi:hypothetical protein
VGDRIDALIDELWSAYHEWDFLRGQHNIMRDHWRVILRRAFGELQAELEPLIDDVLGGTPENLAPFAERIKATIQFWREEVASEGRACACRVGEDHETIISRCLAHETLDAELARLRVAKGAGRTVGAAVVTRLHEVMHGFGSVAEAHEWLSTRPVMREMGVRVVRLVADEEE